MSFNQYMCGSVDVILCFDYLVLWEKQKHTEKKYSLNLQKKIKVIGCNQFILATYK